MLKRTSTDAVGIGLHGGLAMPAVVKADARRGQPQIMREQPSHDPM